MTTPAQLRNSGTHAGSVEGQTRMNPRCTGGDTGGGGTGGDTGGGGTGGT